MSDISWTDCHQCNAKRGQRHTPGCPIAAGHDDPRMHLVLSDMPTYPPVRRDGVKRVPDLCISQQNQQ